jgi:hypothetical protein
MGMLETMIALGESSVTWKTRYDRMKAHYGWTDADIAAKTGNTPGSVVTVVNRPQGFPRWLRLAVLIFEMENSL